MAEIRGSDNSETLNGTAENDKIWSRDGDDTVYGKEGDDWINAEYDDEGDDLYWVYSGRLVALGGPGNDLIGGKEGNDRLYGGTGNDRIYAWAGDDLLDGGDGDDDLSGADGDDTIYGKRGNDHIKPGDGDDLAYGGIGDDWINAFYNEEGELRYWITAGSLTAYGDGGDDLLGGKNGNDRLYGGTGDDRINGRAGNDLIDGGTGDDTLRGANGNDEIKPGDGDDLAYGGDGDDWINAFCNDEGEDRYWTTSGSLTAFGGDGDDLLGGKDGEDQLYGGEGNDRIWAREGDDVLFGGGGNDVLIGGEGNDVIVGNAGDDTLYGNYGQDLLNGGDGDDTYYIWDRADYVQDSSGNDTAIVSVSFAKIPSYIENVTYVDGALPLPYWIDALLPDDANGSNYASLWNLFGQEKTFRYVFPSSVPVYGSDVASIVNLLSDAVGFRQLSASQQRNAVMVLERLEEVIDVSFEQTNDPDQPNTISIALNRQPQNQGGYARYPSLHSSGSDVYLSDTASNATLNPGTRGANTLVHELGHALGLKHPFDEEDVGGGIAEPPYLQGSEDHARWTMMSYTETPDEYKLTFSELDIAALQYLYGPSKKSRTGDDTYVYKTGAPNFIWDGGGEDTVDASASFWAVTIYLEPGYQGFNERYGKSPQISASGQITVNFGSEIENLIGSVHADSLWGNWLDNVIRGNDGADRISGLGGDDSLVGGAGDDVLDGGQGNDRLEPGDGDDSAYGGDGDDRINAGYDLGGTLKAFGGAGNDMIIGKRGNDELHGETGNDRIRGRTGNDYVDGDSGDDVLFGGEGDDELFGGQGDDELFGGDGSDRLNGEGGSDRLSGGEGLDFAIYAGDKERYTIESSSDFVTVIENGVLWRYDDTLEGIERLVFADVNLAFDIDGNAGIAAKALGAFFGAAGLLRTDLAGRWLNLLDNGMTYDDLLQIAIDSVFGANPGGALMVAHFFTALTGEEAPDEVISEWGGKVDNGELSALELSKLVAENDFNLANIDFVGLYSTGVEYLTV